MFPNRDRPFSTVAVSVGTHAGEQPPGSGIPKRARATPPGDGVGAAPRTVLCVGAWEPAGHSRFGWDVDDADPAVQWDDGDEDLLLSL